MKKSELKNMVMPLVEFRDTMATIDKATKNNILLLMAGLRINNEQTFTYYYERNEFELQSLEASTPYKNLIKLADEGYKILDARCYPNEFLELLRDPYGNSYSNAKITVGFKQVRTLSAYRNGVYEYKETCTGDNDINFFIIPDKFWAKTLEIL